MSSASTRSVTHSGTGGVVSTSMDTTPAGRIPPDGLLRLAGGLRRTTRSSSTPGSAGRAADIDGLEYLASPAGPWPRWGWARPAVDHVVLTHLHYDHTGTAREFGAARYVLQRSELGYWTGPWAGRIARERPAGLRGRPGAPAGRRRRAGCASLDGDDVVVPGLSVHLVGGHTAGMQVVRVRTARGHVVLASDASHFYENIEDDRPFAILHSMTGMYGAFDRIRELADGPHLVVAGTRSGRARSLPLLGRSHGQGRDDRLTAPARACRRSATAFPEAGSLGYKVTY